MSASFDIPLLQRKTLAPLQWCVVLIGLSVPISVALDNALLAVILLGAMFNLGSIARIARSHPVARAATLLFLALLLAMSYGMTPLTEAFSILGKYVDLLFIPIMLIWLSNENVRCRARYAFLLAMAITLVMSYLVWMKVLPGMSWMNTIDAPGNPAIFHSYITQNNMMAFAAFLGLLELRSSNGRIRLAWAAFSLLAIINIAFMMQGRTGYLILVVLLTWFAWTTLARAMQRRGRNWGWEQGVYILLLLAAIVSLAYQTSTRLHNRVSLVLSEYRAWTPDHGKDTSTGQRLDFYSNTLQIVEEHALIGVGTGGFPEAFKQQVQGTDVLLTNNPHNEYLLIAVQTGLPGLALLLYLFFTQWRCAPRLPTALEQDAARGLVLAYLVNCMFNSALHDHADGLLFAFMTAALFAGLKQGKQHG